MSAVLPDFAYVPSPESRAAVTLRECYGLFIGGQWVAPEGKATFTTIDPATEETLAQVGRAEAVDVEKAVRAARRGHDKYWRKLRPAERAKYVYRIARTLAERAREIALAETLDTGKPIRETRDFDLAQAAATLFYHAGWADKLEWAVRATERTRSLGVVAAILPSSFPLLDAASRLAPALACGNTLVLKPAESSPLSTLLLAEVCEEAELPPGVVNVVTGGARTGSALVEQNDVNKVSFGGSPEVGKAILRTTAGTNVRLALQLDGTSASILYEDAPFDQAIEGIVSACYFNRGHASAPGSRLLVQESAYDEIVTRLRARIATLRHGDPLDANTDVGAIGSRERRERIAELVRSGVEEGAMLAQASCALPERGFWYPATFFTNVQPAHRIAREAISGPVLGIMTFRTPDEAIERANNIPYGLSAGVWTSSGALALYTAQRLAAGTVWCNTFNQFDPSAPSGGYKESGIGREGGVAGLREYLET